MGVRKLGLPSASVAKELGISPSAVSKLLGRGQQALGNEAIEEYLLESPNVPPSITYFRNLSHANVPSIVLIEF